MASRDSAEKRKPADEMNKRGGSTDPPPPKKLAISLKSKGSSSASVMEHGRKPHSVVSAKDETTAPASISKNTKAAKVFGDEDDDSDQTEEMPPECKMRMRNVGRDTPTSAGPNSFRKGKQGFVDGRKLAERRVQALVDKATDDRPK